MTINFVVAGPGNRPVGRDKVIYEYANYLAQRGHQVSIIFSAITYKDTSVNTWPRKTASFIIRKLTNGYHPKIWFDLDRRVRCAWVPTMHSLFVPDADVTIATAWESAEWVVNYPKNKGKGAYLIQGWETWGGFEERVVATWRFPLEKIFVSKWLAETAQSMGERYTCIPNGLDFDAFGLDLPIEERDESAVMMLYHSAEIKGSRDGLLALEMAQARVPHLKATIFGVSSPPKLPNWMTFCYRVSQTELRRLYNRSAVLVSPSWSEGWPLVPAEGLMCGCAVVATDIAGHREFLAHEKTALLSEPKKPELLADNIVRLLLDAGLRRRLAGLGHRHIQQFTWQQSGDAFERFLVGLAET